MTNVVVIVSDTFRRDHLGCYGNEWIHTENLDRFAEGAMVFDAAYAASFPTVPNRCDLMTGRFTFIEFEWSPLPKGAVVLSDVLGRAGFTTYMVADTPHILQRGYNFDRGFSGFEWIRGQENDRLRTSPRDVRFPCSVEKLRSGEATVGQYLRNVALRRGEEDYFAPRTMSAAMRWLEENRDNAPFFLYVDTFDPHEPWDPPAWYVDLYDPGYEGEEVIYPLYAPADFLTESELKHMRALYAGEVTMVDRWVGRLLRRIEELGLADETVVVFTTDHGFYHGEHGMVGKSRIAKGFSTTVPLYEEVARIPLIVRAPGTTPGRTQALVPPPDLSATILDLAGVEKPPSFQGRSFRAVLEGRSATHRDLAVTTPSLIHGIGARRWSTIADGEWTLLYGGERFEPSRAVTTSIVDSVPRLEKEVFAGGGRPELYHLPSDPAQERDLFDEKREIAQELLDRSVAFFESLGMPPELIENRRRFPD